MQSPPQLRRFSSATSSSTRRQARNPERCSDRSACSLVPFPVIPVRHTAGGDFFLPEHPQIRQPMNTELIIQILTLLLGGGGVIALFFITDRKTKAQIENINLAIDEWQKIVERCRTELIEARTSAKECQDLYMVQFDINTKLRQELDEKNTRIAVLTLLRCKKLKCIDREPPYGSEINEEIEQ